ncbi:hypothetical protein ACS91J_13310 [Pectobacterium carotovorum]|nr:hypothetical protein [Pectobacterium sp. HCp5_1]
MTEKSQERRGKWINLQEGKNPPPPKQISKPTPPPSPPSQKK